MKAGAIGRLVLVAGVFMSLIFVRRSAISFFGVEVPFWDQWDGEIGRLYYTFLDGKLSVGDFFLPANEHRIFYTRLLNLSIFILNDNAISCVKVMIAQNYILCACVAILVWQINGDRLRLFPSLFLLVAYSLPLSWENQFWGYQSQVYFLMLFMVLGLWFASREDVPFIPVALCSCLAAGSMGTAFLCPLLAAMHVSVRAIFVAAPLRLWAKFLGYLTLAAILTRVIWHNPAHEALRARSMSQFLGGWWEYLQWPAMPFKGIGFILTMILASSIGVKIWRREHWNRVERFSLLLCGFVLCLGIMGALGRVGGVAVRYHDYLVLGIFGSILFLCEAPVERSRMTPRRFAAGLGYVTGVVAILSLSSLMIIQAWQRAEDLRRARVEVIRALESERSADAPSPAAEESSLGRFLFPDSRALADLLKNKHARVVFRDYL